MPEDYDFDAAIAHRSNRVREIVLFLKETESRRFVAAMREPLPALIDLELTGWNFVEELVLPDGFLLGSTRHLRRFYLRYISFPALPTFLLSATGLVDLGLINIPGSGFFTPETLVAGLAVVTNLKSLVVGFQSESAPRLFDRFDPNPPGTRIVLPALTRFRFRWKSEYLEYLVARIDAPLLDSFKIVFLNQFVFNLPELGNFMRRTTSFQALNEARMDFRENSILVKSLPSARTFDEESGLIFICKVPVWHLSYLAETLSSLFPSIYIVEHLYIYGPRDLFTFWEDEVDDTRWLETFRPFTAVKDLYLHKEIAQCIAPALQELVEERATYALPALKRIFLEGLETSGPVEEAIGQFVAARQLLGRPVALSRWLTETEGLYLC